jgi:hypothetical protein
MARGRSRDGAGVGNPGNREVLFQQFFQASWMAWGILFLVLAGAAWLILRLRARFRGSEDPAVEGRQMLMQMGELHRQGGLSEEEYRSIRSRLSGPIDDTTRGNGPPS